MECGWRDGLLPQRRRFLVGAGVGWRAELLVRLDDPSKLALRYEWSTDGERFYFALTEYESDVWVMELETTPR